MFYFFPAPVDLPRACGRPAASWPSSRRGRWWRPPPGVSSWRCGSPSPGRRVAWLHSPIAPSGRRAPAQSYTETPTCARFQAWRTPLYTPGHRSKLIVVSINKTFVLMLGSPKSGDESGAKSGASTARGTDPAFCQVSHPSGPIRRRTRRLWPISTRQAGGGSVPSSSVKARHPF